MVYFFSNFEKVFFREAFFKSLTRVSSLEWRIMLARARGRPAAFLKGCRYYQRCRSAGQGSNGIGRGSRRGSRWWRSASGLMVLRSLLLGDGDARHRGARARRSGGSVGGRCSANRAARTSGCRLLPSPHSPVLCAPLQDSSDTQCEES